MRLFLDSLWRALAYCLRPQIILLTLAPVLFLGVVTLALGYFFWEPALNHVRVWLDSFAQMGALWQWLYDTGEGKIKAVLAPLIVIFGVTPLLVVATLFMVAFFMSPAIVRLVAARRFAALEVRHGAGFLESQWSAWSSAFLALVALLVSIPLWVVPPLFLVLPPLIWGWLTYRVMAFDALALHASREERQLVLKKHRGGLLALGVLSGYGSMLPSWLWATGTSFAPMFVLLAPLAIWVYTLVFAFTSLWFTHFSLKALQELRSAPGGAIPALEEST